VEVWCGGNDGVIIFKIRKICYFFGVSLIYGGGSSATVFNPTDAAPYFFASDFSCSSTRPLTSGSSILRSIVANYITIAVAGGQTVTAILGACSNILLLNQSQPRVGNNIYWRGLAVGTSTFQVYSALLF